MGKLLSSAEKLFWLIVWVFLALIAGYFILSVVQNKAGGNFLGNFAGKIGYYARGEEVQ